MEIVLQKVGAAGASVPVIDSKEGAVGPPFDVQVGGFGDLQDDGYPVFVVVSDQSLVGIGSVAVDVVGLVAGVLGLLHAVDIVQLLAEASENRFLRRGPGFG